MNSHKQVVTAIGYGIATVVGTWLVYALMAILIPSFAMTPTMFVIIPIPVGIAVGLRNYWKDDLS